MIRLAGIVLAAGESRRMGQPKALLLYRGRTFVDAILEIFAAAGLDEFLVVLGPDPGRVQAGARLPRARVVVNERYPEGQFSSLRAGVAALSEGIAAAVVALVDQPQVRTEVVTALVDVYRNTRAPVVRPVWQGRGGHPLLFSEETFGDILALPESATTYEVVRRFLDRRRDVPAPDDSVLTDIDTPEDYRRLDSPA